MIIDMTQAKIERQMEKRLHFPIREDITVLGGHPLTILWTSDPYPSEVGMIVIDNYKITRAMKKITRKKVAIFDGCPPNVEIGLYWEDIDENEEPEEIEWPKEWTERVSADFLKEQGYECITA